MAITNERATILSEFLTTDIPRARILLTMPPENAVEEINSYGFDFTLDEINAFGIEMATAVKNGITKDELNEESLSDVAGGAIGVLTAAACVAAAKLGYEIGKDLVAKHGW